MIVTLYLWIYIKSNEVEKITQFFYLIKFNNWGAIFVYQNVYNNYLIVREKNWKIYYSKYDNSIWKVTD